MINNISDDVNFSKNNIAENIRSLNIPNNITLVAVSKRKPIEFIENAYLSGQRIFGENYIQEGISKVEYFRGNKSFKDIKWYFIGHLQSNKVELAVKYFDMIQTLDSEKLAKKINSVALKYNKNMPVLIQINIGNEEQKHGIKEQELHEFLKSLEQYKNLNVCGLMCIPPNHDDPKYYFREMKFLFDTFKDKYNLTILSMGMSSDFNIAISQGSTMVRIGSKIFGARN